MPMYSIDHLRSVARSKDNRLEDKNKYSDAWIDDKIDHAFETAESGKQVFSVEEVVDLQPYVVGGEDQVLIEMDQEVHSFYNIQTDHDGVTWSVKNDNTVVVYLDVNDDKVPTITFRYWYFPHTKEDNTGYEIYMGVEVYHYFRHCLYVQLYGSLRDLESEMYHQKQVDRFIADGTFSLPNDFDEQIGMKGGFATPFTY